MTQDQVPRVGAEVSLREITRETLSPILQLKVAPDQERFVASNAASIAQAHFSPEAWFRAIYADDIPVGFAMLSVRVEEVEYYLWRFMIDARFQRHGFGAAALDLLVEHVKTLPNATELLLGFVDAPGCAEPFYEKNGFERTGEVEHGEVVMRLRW